MDSNHRPPSHPPRSRRMTGCSDRLSYRGKFGPRRPGFTEATQMIGAPGGIRTLDSAGLWTACSTRLSYQRRVRCDSCNGQRSTEAKRTRPESAEALTVKGRTARAQSEGSPALWQAPKWTEAPTPIARRGLARVTLEPPRAEGGGAHSSPASHARWRRLQAFALPCWVSLFQSISPRPQPTPASRRAIFSSAYG